VNLSDIQLDIMDYIRPAECKAEDFRGMWAEFEWENKVCHDPLVSISRTAVTIAHSDSDISIDSVIPVRLCWERDSSVNTIVT
jgi:Coatomer beta subunit appendage platform